MDQQHGVRRIDRGHVRRWATVAALAIGMGLLVVGSVANSDSSFTVTQGDFELTCPTSTVVEGASLACTLKNTAAEAKPWPAVAILHLSTDTDRALVRGSEIDVTLGAPSPAADLDGGVTWIGDTLVGYSRFDWSGDAGAQGAAGNSRTVNIVAANDGLDENSERFYVALGPDASKGVGLLYNNKAGVTLTDDDSPSTDTSLSSLEMFAGQSYTLSPTQAALSQAVGYEVTEATLTAEAARGTTMTMSASFDGSGVDLDGRGGNSIEVTSDEESAAVPLGVGTTTVTLTVTAEDGTTTGARTVSIVRSALGDNVDTVAVSVPDFTLTCPAEVDKGTDAQCTLLASGSAGWPVVAVIHSSANGASRALVAEDPIIPDTHPDYSKDVSLGAQQPARTDFNHGYGELFSGGSRALYRTYGYEKFDWSGTASAGDTRTVTIQLHDNALNGGNKAKVFYVALAPSGYTGLSQLVDNKVPVVIAPGIPTVIGVEVVSDAGGDDTYAMGEVISFRVTFSEAVDVTGTPLLGIDMDPAHWGRKDAVYTGGSGTAELTFAHEVIQPNFSSQGIAVLADTLDLDGGTIQSSSSQIEADLAHTSLGHDPDHMVDWRLVAPRANGNNEQVFLGTAQNLTNAPPGILVNFEVAKDDFSDADGDPLVFTVSASRDDVYVPGGLLYNERIEHIFLQVKTACALAGLDPPAGYAYDTVVTLTATDPDGASAQATVTFRTDPATPECPSLSSAAVDGTTLTITLDNDVVPSIDSATADEFAVKVNGEAVSLASAGTGAVSASGTTIVLTLATPVPAGRSVTVSYTGDNPVAAVFTDQPVTNQTPPPPLLGPYLTMTCSPAQLYDAANQRWTLIEPFVAANLVAGQCSVTSPEDALAAYSLSGADADMFEISPEGVLRFAAKPDFEAPADSDKDNVYEVAVAAIVGNQTTSIDLAVAITDAQEPEVTVIEVVPFDPPVCAPDPAGTMVPVCAAVSGNELTLTFNRSLAAVDDTTAASLKQGFLIDGGRDSHGTPVPNQSPSQVTVDGATVTFTLGAPIAPGNYATVTYFGFGSLTDADDISVPAFTTTFITTERD